jgi:hypothetical protein
MVLSGKSTQIGPQFRVNRLDGHKLDAVNDGQVGSHYPSQLRVRIKTDSIFSRLFTAACFFLVLFWWLFFWWLFDSRGVGKHWTNRRTGRLGLHLFF